jgi:hypothetical protein
VKKKISGAAQQNAVFLSFQRTPSPHLPPKQQQVNNK